MFAKDNPRRIRHRQCILIIYLEHSWLQLPWINEHRRRVNARLPVAKKVVILILGNAESVPKTILIIVVIHVRYFVVGS